MAHFFRQPDRRQRFLLPVDMMDWLPEEDIVHLIVDAVGLMDLSGFETTCKVGGVGQAQANAEAVAGEDAVLGAATADAGYWSEANVASETEECELFIATKKDHKQRKALRDAPPPQGRMPKNLSARDRMDRKLSTKRGRAIYRQRGVMVEPVFGQMKDRQGAGRFSMRGLERCRGEWQLDATVHNLRKLHRESVRGAGKAGNGSKKARMTA